MEQYCPSESEVKKAMHSSLKFSITMLEGMFHKKPTRESVQGIKIPAEHIVPHIREEWLREVYDKWNTKKLFDMIQKGEDISEYLKKMVRDEFTRDETISNQAMNYIMVWAYQNNMTLNEYWNKITWADIQSNTRVLFDWKEQTYLQVYKKILTDLFHLKAERAIQDLKWKCSM